MTTPQFFDRAVIRDLLSKPTDHIDYPAYFEKEAKIESCQEILLVIHDIEQEGLLVKYGKGVWGVIAMNMDNDVLDKVTINEKDYKIEGVIGTLYHIPNCQGKTLHILRLVGDPSKK